MANEKIVYVACSSKKPDNFRFISFVSPAEDVSENNASSTSNSVNVNGEDASQIYNDIISSPPTSILPKISPQKLKESHEEQNLKNYNHRLTIFHHAQQGNIAGIKYLLSKGSNIDEQDMYGWTALMCSTFEGHIAVVEYLMISGANLDIKNNQGLTALDIAIRNNHVTLIHRLKNRKIETNFCKKNEVEKEQKYCSLCDYWYTESSSAKHETSIAHLINSKRNTISTFYHLPENNKGFQIMLKKGWDKNKGLGINAEGRKFPVKTVLKRDRSCIGCKKETPKVTHFGPNDYNSVKKYNKDTVKSVREKTVKKWERIKLERRNRKKEIEFRREFL